ncbi:MAG: MBL fold metallo-hydrolase [Treponema sp.]|nr:MBL fold metallo-hydrolase [Treponema sp.]
MKVHFWGVRGSVPTPLTPQQVQSKIMAAIQRVTPHDIVSEDARARFINNLPPWLFGTTGGNTPCVQLSGDDGTEVILDAGSGLRAMGKSVSPPPSKKYYLLFSHYHWDHIQGLPFFDHAYNPDMTFEVYSAFPAAKKILARQMYRPYYPVSFESLTKNFIFHCIKPGELFRIGCFDVCCCKMSHPGNSYSYAFKCNGKHFVYATDVGLSQKDFARTPEHVAVFENADVIILDSQYTVAEAHEKENWGHSAFCYAIDFAIHWHIKDVYLFHHEPTYDDRKLNAILTAARWYAHYVEHSGLSVFIAQEGKEIEL